jgi:hypothetical protein
MTLTDNLGPNADAFYTTLMQAHEGLTDAESHALNARLVLVFANHIGDLDTLTALIRAAAGAKPD